MGAGIAVKFRRQWPAMYSAYHSACAARQLQAGDVFIWPSGDITVYNLMTQVYPGADAKLAHIEKAVIAMLLDAAVRDIGGIGIPRIGCGIGGLEWDDVQDCLQGALDIADPFAGELAVYSL